MISAAASGGVDDGDGDGVGVDDAPTNGEDGIDDAKENKVVDGEWGFARAQRAEYRCKGSVARFQCRCRRVKSGKDVPQGKRWEWRKTEGDGVSTLVVSVNLKPWSASTAIRAEAGTRRFWTHVHVIESFIDALKLTVVRDELIDPKRAREVVCGEAEPIQHRRMGPIE